MWYENLTGQLESSVSHTSLFDALVGKNAKQSSVTTCVKVD